MTKQYLEASKDILTNKYSDFKWGSKGSGIISFGGPTYSFDLREGLPLLTTKDMNIEKTIHELLWFLKGDTNIKYLEDNKVSFWRADAFQHNLEKMISEGIFPKNMPKYSNEWNDSLKEYGKMIREDKNGFAENFGEGGPIYGQQWRKWKYFDEDKGELIEIDQIENLIEKIKKNPTSKKKIVSAWNPGDVPKMSLAPCHTMFQVHGNEEGQIDVQLYQRSSDFFLGVPHNDVSYSMVAKILANETGMEARRFIHNFGDAHFYTSTTQERSEWYKNNLPELKEKVKDAGKISHHSDYETHYSEVIDWINKNAPEEREGKKGYDHVTAILEQLDREPKPLPKLEIANKPFDELKIDDFKITNYDPHPAIRRKMAV